MANLLDTSSYEFYCHEDPYDLGSFFGPTSKEVSKNTEDLHNAVTQLGEDELCFESFHTLPSLLFGQNEDQDQEVPGNPIHPAEIYSVYYQSSETRGSKTNSSKACVQPDVASNIHDPQSLLNFVVPQLSEFDDEVDLDEEDYSMAVPTHNFAASTSPGTLSHYPSPIVRVYDDDDSSQASSDSDSEDRELNSCASGDQLVPNVTIEE